MNSQSLMEGDLILSVKILNVNIFPPNNSISSNLPDRNAHTFGQVVYKMFIVALSVRMENWKQSQCPSIKK